MRLLIVTQKIDRNDAVLGFMHGWIEEFARQTESVLAFCLQKGEVNLPDNASAFSLGKEKAEDAPPFARGFGGAKLGWAQRGLTRIKYIVIFLRYIILFRKEYDAVFVHMNPEYIVLGGLFWKVFGKTTTLWYAHKSINFSLCLATFLSDVIFTSTKSGFRLPSGKVKVVGQGIDINKFQIPNSPPAPRLRRAGKFQTGSGDGTFKIVSVGRVTPSKDYDTLIEAITRLRKEVAIPISVSIAGPTSLDSDRAYLERLKEKINQKNLAKVVTFYGPIPNNKLPELLSEYDLFVNMGLTGSLDKAVPEAMASGLPVLTCNEAFKEVLGPYTKDLMYPKGNSEALARKIRWIMEMPVEKRQELGRKLRDIVVREHSLPRFVEKIIFGITAVQQHKPRYLTTARH